MEWKEVRLGDYIKTNETQYSIKENWENFVYLDTGSIIERRIDKLLYFTKEDKLPSRARRKVQHGDIIYSCVRPNQRHYGYINIPVENLLVSTGFVVISCKDIDSKYLYYYLTQDTIINYLQNIGEQSVSTYPTIKPQDIEDIFIRIPSDIEDQRRIASILSSLDRKIELNNKINADLEEMAQAIFKNWFVDFEPFKDGKFVDSELGMIPEGWKVGGLFDIAEIFDKKRKPLSGNVREKMDKIYPYYGATSCMDYVDDYIFDGIYTLIGEDGSVVKENGLPYMQYVWGKMWVNNHAHILQGKNGYSTEMIHALLSITNIKFLVTGAVQAKLSQGNMQKILVAIPPKNVLDEIRPVIDNLYSKIRINTDENSRLSLLRDTLLPRLISGELEVPE